MVITIKIMYNFSPSILFLTDPYFYYYHYTDHFYLYIMHHVAVDDVVDDAVTVIMNILLVLYLETKSMQYVENFNILKYNKN